MKIHIPLRPRKLHFYLRLSIMLLNCVFVWFDWKVILLIDITSTIVAFIALLVK